MRSKVGMAISRPFGLYPLCIKDFALPKEVSVHVRCIRGLLYVLSAYVHRRTSIVRMCLRVSMYV